MRVFLVTEAYSGGVRRHLLDLVRGCVSPKRSFTAVFSCMRKPETIDDAEKYAEMGIHFIPLPMKRSVSPWSDLVALFRLITLFRKGRPDVIHAHSSKAGFLARLAGLLCGIPVVYTPHAFPFMMGGASRKIGFYRFCERMARPWTAALIAVSRQEAEAARSIGYPEKQIVLIPNGIQSPAEHSRKTISDRFRIGYMGRLAPQKGVELLPELAKALLPVASRVSFVIAGDGECRENIERSFPENIDVKFLGTYSSVQRDGILNSLDVLLVPSRWESCPYVVLEAWAAGAPVIASPAIDLIRRNDDGIILPRTDITLWVAAIQRLMENPEEREQLISAGRKRVEKDFRLDDMCAKTCAVYDSVHTQSKNGGRKQ